MAGKIGPSKMKSEIGKIVKGDAVLEYDEEEGMTLVEVGKSIYDTVIFTLEGIEESVLVTHRFSEKAKRQMLGAQQGDKTKSKPPRDPFKEFADSLYWLDPTPKDRPKNPTLKEIKAATFGFRTCGIKACIVAACRQYKQLTMKAMQGVVLDIGHDMVAIEGTPDCPDVYPEMREDTVRIGNGSADLRYRGEFWPWRIRVPLKWNPSYMSLRSFINLTNTAGECAGLGENRPERGGSWGRFRVAEVQQNPTPEMVRACTYRYIEPKWFA